MAADNPDVPDHKIYSAQTSDTLKALELYKQKDVTKGILPFLVIISPPSQFLSPVVVRFKAVGNAPIMKQNFYKITSSNRFQAVIQFLRKELGWAANEPLVRGQYISLISMPIF
jgi:ubiquitin-like protein ATG12